MFSVIKEKYQQNAFKGCVCYIFTSLFFMSQSNLETRKNVFYFISKVLFVLEIFLTIFLNYLFNSIFLTFMLKMASWRRQMLKHETRNTFY